jgi:LysR family transcriptional regulator, glycine cleavage system transcriptional activator
VLLGEARLPLLSADLMARHPLRRPADLAHHTLLHSDTLRDAWLRWLAAARLSDLTPGRDQVFEHFYFAIQAALDELRVMMGPIALVGQELQSGRLVMPWPEPALRSRGYFMHTPQARRNAPAVAALRRWLLHAGQATEAEYPAYLAACRGSNRTTSSRTTR